MSDRREDWEKNFRCPDVAIVLPGSRAVDCDTFFFGGPDLVVEIASDYDRSREKIDFYARVGVRELLLVDRSPWRLERYRLDRSEFKLAGASDQASQQTMSSEVLALTFRLLARPSARPQIEVHQPATGGRWFA